MKELTSRQKEVLDFIIRFQKDCGYSPSIREIANDRVFGIRAAADYVKVLKKKGYIDYTERTNRSIRVIA